MTSKEALQGLRNIDDLYYKNLYEENFDTIEKDLEILEILKSYLSQIKIPLGEDRVEWSSHIELDIDEYSKDYGRVKEWFENEYRKYPI